MARTIQIEVDIDQLASMLVANLSPTEFTEIFLSKHKVFAQQVCMQISQSPHSPLNNRVIYPSGN